MVPMQGSHDSGKFTGPCMRAIEYSLAHFLHEQAVFFAERLAAETPACDEALKLLVVAYLRSGDAARAHALLQERRSADQQLRYLLALCCLRLDRAEEAESVLLGCAPVKGAPLSAPLLDSVPGGAPGLYLLGQAKERLHLREQAAECYSKCLEQCPFMWCAYERLSALSFSTPSSRSSTAATHAHAAGFPASSGPLLGAGSARAFAGAYFAEERLRSDPVLHPPGAAPAAAAAASAPPQQTRPSGAVKPGRPTPLAPAAPEKKRCRGEVPVSPNGARQHRGRSPATPSMMMQGTGSSPIRAALGRVPLADRSVDAAMQDLSPLQPQMPPLPWPLAVAHPGGPAGGEAFASEVDLPTWGSLPSFCTDELPRELPDFPVLTLQPQGQQASLGACLRLFGEALRALHAFQSREALAALAALPAKQRATALAQDLAARCHFELADYGHAADAFAACCQAHKRHRAVSFEYYSTALWHLRDPIKLGVLAQEVLEWDRLRPQAWCVVGNTFSLQSERDSAIRCFRRAVQLDASFVYAYTLIAHEYAASEKYDKAIQMYEQAVALDCRHYNAWWGLGNVFYRQEEYQSARYHFQRAVDINGGNAVLRTSLGMALQATQEPERALELFSGAERSQQCSALAMFQKGCVLESLGRHEEAVQALRRAQGLAPREPCVHFHLGRAHVSSGDVRRALLHFTMAMDLCGAKDSKDHQMIVSAQRELMRSVSLPGTSGHEPHEGLHFAPAATAAAGNPPPSMGVRRTDRRRLS